LKAFFHVRPDDLSDPLFSHIPRWDLTAKLKRFFSDNTREALRGYDARIELRESLSGDFFRWDPFSQAQYLETTCLLPGYILSSQGDRMAMAHSVEGRFPFLDHRVVEFAARVPPRLKMRALNEKYLLKQAARSLVPAGIIRRPKQPYRAPEAGSFWINGRSRQEYVEDVLSPDRIRANGIFNPAAVQTLVEKAKADRVVSIKDNMALVGILSTQLLVEQLVKNYGKYPIHARN